MEKSKMFLTPLSKYDEEKKRMAWLDPNEVAGIEAYESDYTITILFKSGTRMKYGPFTEEDYYSFLDAVV